MGCSLSDDKLIEAVEIWNNSLCESGGKSWVLRIPADPDRCPDLLIQELCDRFKETLRSEK